MIYAGDLVTNDASKPLHSLIALVVGSLFQSIWHYTSILYRNLDPHTINKQGQIVYKAALEVESPLVAIECENTQTADAFCAWMNFKTNSFSFIYQIKYYY